MIKSIFAAGSKKTERIDPSHPNFQKISSYGTATTFRAVWENFFHYLREHWNIKDAEKITGEMIASYMDYKSEYHISKQYLEKISSALGKLEIALKNYTKNKYGEERFYDFSIRHFILNESRNLELVVDNYHNRAYEHPERVIESLSNDLFRLVARIQLSGGCRLEGIGLIHMDQLHGIRFDNITATNKGVLFTKEKGGKAGDVLISIDIYEELSNYLSEHKRLKIDRQKYSSDIRETCKKLGIPPEGSHAFRWNFAKHRIMEYARANYTYEQCLQAVSWEMKHNRACITEHYLGS